MTGATEKIPAVPHVDESVWTPIYILKRQLRQLAEMFLWEYNDGITRNHLENMMKTWMSFQFKTGRCHEYVVRCDVINNKPEVIDRNQLIVDVAVKFLYKDGDGNEQETPFIFIPITLKNGTSGPGAYT